MAAAVGTISLVAVALLLIAAAAVFVARRSRARLLSALKADWGTPVKRPRNMAAIAASHRSRRSSVTQPGDALDDRTWDDLNLDDVFAAWDRTESTLGQHALYYRLRTTPLGDQLDALVASLRVDTPNILATWLDQTALSSIINFALAPQPRGTRLPFCGCTARHRNSFDGRSRAPRRSIACEDPPCRAGSPSLLRPQDIGTPRLVTTVRALISSAVSG